MKVKELKKVIIGKMIVYELTEDGFGETLLWDGMRGCTLMPDTVGNRKVAFVKADFIDRFKVYVKRED